MAEIESTVEDRGGLKRQLKVQVAAARVSQAVDKAYERLRARAKVPGFRQGKVPRNILEKHYGEQVHEDVHKDLIEITCAEVLREHGLDIVSAPVLVGHEHAADGGLSYTADIEVRPTFTLHDYKGRDLFKRIARVGEGDVDGALQRLRERMAQLQTEEDRVNVARGDVVVFDMDASSEGKAIESATGQGLTIEVGAGRFPEDFEKQLVGVTRGIRTPLDVRFPEDHADKDLAGKLVRFEVTVREIKNKVLPNLDDDFVRDLDFQGCDTMEQLRAKVREDLQRHARTDAERRARNRLLEAYVDEHEFAVPESHVDRQIGSMLHDMGIHEVPEDKVDELRSALEPSAVKHVKARFILDAIAKAETLEVSEEEIASELNRQVAQAGQAADRVRQHYSERSAIVQLHANMLRDKALARIIEFSAQREEEVDKSELADGR